MIIPAVLPEYKFNKRNFVDLSGKGLNAMDVYLYVKVAASSFNLKPKYKNDTSFMDGFVVDYVLASSQAANANCRRSQPRNCLEQ